MPARLLALLASPTDAASPRPCASCAAPTRRRATAGAADVHARPRTGGCARPRRSRWFHEHVGRASTPSGSTRRRPRTPSGSCATATARSVYVGARVAADFGNAAFRAWWIARAQARRRRPPRPVRSTTSSWSAARRPSAGVARTPIDPRTGADDDRGELADATWPTSWSPCAPRCRASRSSTTCSGTRATPATSCASCRPRTPSRSTRASTTRRSPTAPRPTATQTLAGWIEREQARGGAVILDAPTTTAAAARCTASRATCWSPTARPRWSTTRSTAPDALLGRLRRRPRRAAGRALLVRQRLAA